MEKCKVLLLSTHDSHLGGHAWAEMQQYDKDKYDTKLVTLYSLTGSKEYAIIANYSLYRNLDLLLRIIANMVAFGRIRRISREKYCYFRYNYFPISAKRILRKYNNGNPDAIVLHWCDGFISPKLLYNLYKLTGATIHICFTDEHALGGGCHYPCDCKEYESGCKSCPALLTNKKVAAKFLERKLRYFSLFPKVVIANGYCIEKAKQSRIFKYRTSYIHEFSGVTLSHKPDYIESRERYNISNSDFVIMFGALNMNEERKGLHILFKALEIVSERLNVKITALVPGQIEYDFTKLKNINVHLLGVLQFDDLCKAYAASNVYVSPSLADSGPIMVKYAIACGVPVVSFPIGNALDFVKHKQTGYLAKYADPEDIANGIMFFWENRQYSEDFRNNCLRLNESACTDFTYHYEVRK